MTKKIIGDPVVINGRRLSLSRAALIADWLLCPFRRREEARFLSAQAAQSAARKSARL